MNEVRTSEAITQTRQDCGTARQEVGEADEEGVHEKAKS
jgi:hypothetical protein